MKLHEIVLVKRQLESSKIEHSAFETNGKRIGFAGMNNFELWMFSAKGEKQIKKLSLINAEKQDVAYLVGIFFKHHGATFFKLDRAWTNPEYRGKDLMSGMIYEIKRQMRIHLMCDRDMTEAGLGLWKKIRTQLKVEIYDSVTGQKLPWSKANEKALFVREEDFVKVKDSPEHPIAQLANRYYLVAESTGREQYQGIPSVPARIISRFSPYLDRS